MRAGGYYHYAFSNSQHIFLTKELDKHDGRRISARHTPLQKGSFGCCAVEEHVYFVVFIAMLIRFDTALLVCENKNNGDKLHRKKSMRAADEKLIFNELGPNL